MVSEPPRRHGEPKRKRAVHNAGAFYTPDTGAGGMIPVPMRTLSDDYSDEPTEPEDDEEPEPEARGFIRRVVERVTRRADPGR